MQSTGVATLISGLHALYVLWFMYAPFSENILQLSLHVVVAPAMVVHWLLNNDTCVLTAIEAGLRNISPGETFIGRLMSPIYLLPDGNHQILWYGSAGFLWVRSLTRLRALLKEERKRVWSTSSSSPASNQGCASCRA